MNYNNYQPQQHHQQHHQQHQHHQPQHHQQQPINGGFNATSNKLITPPEGCKTLWAGDLHGCDENYVKSMFSHVGEVISVKLIKDKVTQQPMGYGFIEFATPYQAQVALSLNGTTVGYTGRFYRLNWAKNIPNQNQSQVQHAPSHHQAPQRQHSNPHMRQNPMHGNPNMGKGQYMQPQMKQPMYHPQHMVPQPQIMQSPSVMYQPQMMHQPRGHYQQQTYQPRQPRQPSQSLQDTSEMGEYSVFVGDLSPEVNDFMLRQAFQRYKSLATARVIFDPNNHLSKMYGFVSFNDANDYHSALANMGATYIGSRPIKVNTAKKEKSHLEAQLIQKQQGFQPTTGTLPTPSPTGHKTFSNMSLNLNNQSRDVEDPNNKVLFIGALGGETTEEDLYRVFNAYGEIRACKISLNKDCGFVEYYSREDAKKAFILDGTILDSKKIFINWANNPELKTNNTRFKNYREERVNNQIPIPMIQRQSNFQEPYDVDLANQYFLDNNSVSISPFPHDYISTVVPSRNNYQNYYY